MPDLVDQLVSRPGLYVGSDVDPTEQHQGGAASAARILVAALPGGSGVTFDYEVLSATGGRVHDEHAVLARTPSGLVLITAHSHATVATILHETAPGDFAPDDAPFPMAIRLEVPEPGHLRYLWSYGMPGEEPQLRDVGDVTLVAG